MSKSFAQIYRGSGFILFIQKCEEKTRNIKETNMLYLHCFLYIHRISENFRKSVQKCVMVSWFYKNKNAPLLIFLTAKYVRNLPSVKCLQGARIWSMQDVRVLYLQNKFHNYIFLILRNANKYVLLKFHLFSKSEQNSTCQVFMKLNTNTKYGNLVVSFKSEHNCLFQIYFYP